jgi:3-deoxy-manno-octulosonate cytidylyltransferase (CMP-KDO synthetase)
VIEHVVAAGLKSLAQRPVLVATDDERIAVVIRTAFSADEADVVMTSESCRTGTDRIADVVRNRFADRMATGRLVIVNVQGDEPFVSPRHIDALIEAMHSAPELRMATLANPIETVEDRDNPNIVKVVLDARGEALYFSRCTIPCARDGEEHLTLRRLRHLGIYAYEASWLLEMASLPATPLEETEKLEQLRALENGVDIKVVVVEDVVPIAIDTPEDLERAARYLETREN